MNIVRDIQSISDFKQNASKLIKQVQDTKKPIVLTVNGKAAVVVQDAESYQYLIEKREYDETVAVLKDRLSDIDNAHNWPTAEEVFTRLFTKYGIERVADE